MSMSRASTVRRIAYATAYGGGGLVAAGAALFAVLRGETRMARRRVLGHENLPAPPDGSGIWGSGTGAVCTLAMLGDSSAEGRGVQDVGDTPGVLLAAGLAELTGNPVRLVQLAISGSESSDLAMQVERVLPTRPDLTVIMIGANDVTARIPARQAAAHLRRAVLTLRQAGGEVVVGTCPDLGTLRPVPQPLRLFGRRWSRQLAAAQSIAVVEAGGRSVSLGSLLGPEFARRPEMFSVDEFHPSAAGYAAVASVMLPSIAAALDVPAAPRRERRPEPRRPAQPVATAALSAADRPGTELSPAPSGRAGLRDVSMAQSIRRRPARLSAPDDAADNSGTGHGERA